MSFGVTDEIRQALVERGLWEDFASRRVDARERLGVGEAAAGRAVLAEIAPDLVPPPKKRGRPRKDASVVVGAVIANEKESQSGRCDGNRGSSSSVVKYGSVNPRVFNGKRCSLSTAFMWAYSNLCIRGIKPSDAPSAVAWQMYCDMLSSPALKSDMLKAGLSSAMRKADVEDEKDRKFDGEGEYDLLAAISGMEVK